MNLSITPGQRLAPPPTPEPGSPRPPKRRERRPRGFLLRWLGRLVGALAGLALLAAVVATVGIYAADGTLLTDLSTERRIFVPINAIPQQVKSAFVSAEDRNFWTHPGVDPMAIVRAAVTDLAHLHEGRRPLGASTITQQVAKNMLLSGELTLARKIREAILAMRIERSLSKERILELYLNQIYLGQGAYGVAAAAQTYFNKPLAELSLSEAAMLAALPKAPNIYNPFRNPEAA